MSPPESVLQFPETGLKTPENRKILNHGLTRNDTDEDPNLEVRCHGTTISVCFRVVPCASVWFRVLPCGSVAVLFLR
jgi:hypothetical protein